MGTTTKTIALLTFATGLAPLAHPQEIWLTLDPPLEFAPYRTLDRLGDVNSDGIPDFLVSTHIGGPEAFGRVRVLSGVDGSPLYHVIGEDDSDLLGLELADLGDYDGDGVPDFAATGAYGFEVFSGVNGHRISETPWDSNLVNFGDIDGADDVNGDGYNDLIVAGSDPEVRIYGGPDTHLLRTHIANSNRPGIAGVGDVNGDGYDDYAIGSARDATNGPRTGAVRVHSGFDGSVLIAVFGERPFEGSSFGGDNLGYDVGGVGDVNGDGVPDFAGGAPGQFGFHNSPARGWVRVYSGLDGSIIHHVDGLESYAETGLEVEGRGDVNGDGYDDFLVGAPNGSDFSGRGSINIHSGRTGTPLFRVVGQDGGHRIGQWTEILDDYDGDGYAEFGYGDPQSDATGVLRGRIWIFKGAPGDAQEVCPPTPNSAGAGVGLTLARAISVGHGRLDLSASGGPPERPAVFFYGDQTTNVPFGDGLRCAAGNIFRLNPPITFDAAGNATREIDFASGPTGSGPGAWTVGSAWTLQMLYRDPGGPGGSGFNLSAAVRMEPTP